mgnify:CR=1 FL=1
METFMNISTNNAKVLAHWYVTTRCNSRCRTCSIWRDPSYNCSESILESKVQLLYQLKQLGFLSIDFTGGEPLLYPHLPDLLKQARNLGIMTWVTTNGLLYKKQALALKGLVSQLSFSLDSPISEINDRIRGIKHFKKAISAMKYAIGLGELPMIKATVCNENVGHLNKFAKLAQKLGVLIEFNAEFTYFGNEPLNKDGINEILKIRKHPNVIVSMPHLQFMKDGGNNPQRPKCHIGRNIIAIAPDNSLYYPCMHMNRKKIPLEKESIRKTLFNMNKKGLLDKIGRFSFCNKCTIPCFMEPSYYTQIDKYFLKCYLGRMDYLKKRMKLNLTHKFHR